MQRLLIRNIVCACSSLDRRTDALRHASSLATETGARLHVLRLTAAHGQPGAAIGAYAVRVAAGLVVIGHEDSAAATACITGEVVRHARCPVLVVPTGLPTTKRTGGYREIVCAVSSGLSTSTLQCALSIAQEFQSRLTLVNVDSPALWGRWHPGRDILEADMDRLRSHIPEDAHAWCDIDELVCHGDPATEVGTVAARVNADLLVVGTSACDDPQAGAGALAPALLTHRRWPVLVVPAAFVGPIEPATQYADVDSHAAAAL